MSRMLCMGNQALAFGALKAGVRLASGYPGTPSTEILETLAAELKARRLSDLHIEWSTNEKAALEVAIGAAFAGARALVTMKQVGLNVASDALMSLPYLGVKGGLVLVVADDPGPISSQTEQDTRQFAGFAKLPVLDPSTPGEAFKMVPAAFELSERHQTPVIIRPTTRVCHGTAAIEPPDAYLPHPISGFERSPRWVVFPRRSYLGHLEILERLPKIAAEFAESPFNEMYQIRPNAPAHFGIVANGISYAYLNDALLGLTELPALRILKLGTPFPFPEKLGLEFLGGLSEVLVFEELEPVIERELLQLAGRHHLKVTVLGKLSGHTAKAGENSVKIIHDQVCKFCDIGFWPARKQVIDIGAIASTTVGGSGAGGGARSAGAGAAGSAAGAAGGTGAAAVGGTSSQADPSLSTSEVPDLPARPPVLCAGCPHRASFFAVKQALKGRPAIFSGDIGCYTLGNAQPLDMVDSCLCMGAGLTIPQGMAWAEPETVHLGFVGDSTFFASGLTGVVNAVYNQAKVTLCILDNSTTAMTGAQPHPGTGVRLGDSTAGRNAAGVAESAAAATAAGAAGAGAAAARAALNIPQILHALGVQSVAEVDPLNQKESVDAVLHAVDFDGVSAVVFKSPCVTLVAPKPQLRIDADICTNCRRCVKAIGCPALISEGGKIAIDKTLCYGCGLCLELCPFAAIIAAENSDSPNGAVL